MTTGILHVDMDAFFCSVELLSQPELRGKPAVVAHDSVRSVVTSATYEARAFGIRSAMPLSAAKKLCPNLIVLEPHRHLYVEYSAQVMDIFREFTPLVEPLSIDEAFLDVRGATRLLGDPKTIGHELRERLRERTGLTASVGVAATKFVAKLASGRAKPDGLLVVPEDETLAFLHPLPIGALWGVGRQTQKVLAGRGLHTVADVAETPLRSLTSALGESAGRHLHELSWGRDARAVVPERIEKSVGREHTFEKDVRAHAELENAMLDQSQRVGRSLRQAGYTARTISIKVTYADFQSLTRSRTLPEPSDTSREIFRVACELLAELNVDFTHRPVRLIGVRASNLEQGASGVLALWSEDEGWHDAELAIDKATDRFGRGAVMPASLLRKRDLREDMTQLPGRDEGNISN